MGAAGGLGVSVFGASTLEALGLGAGVFFFGGWLGAGLVLAVSFGVAGTITLSGSFAGVGVSELESSGRSDGEGLGDSGWRDSGSTCSISATGSTGQGSHPSGHRRQHVS